METWDLTDELREKFKPIVENYLRLIESENIDDINKHYLELTNQGISPMQLKELLEELGYKEKYSLDSNGWQFDFWWYFTNPQREKYAKELCITGCGISFDLILRSDIDREK